MTDMALSKIIIIISFITQTDVSNCVNLNLHKIPINNFPIFIICSRLQTHGDKVEKNRKTALYGCNNNFYTKIICIIFTL